MPRVTVKSSGQVQTCTHSGNAELAPLEARIHLLTLEIVVHHLERERDGLQRARAECERTIKSQEAEIRRLEETIERKERQLLQRIENYERIIADKNRAYRDLAQEDASQSTRSGHRSPFARSLYTKTREWFKRNILR